MKLLYFYIDDNLLLQDPIGWESEIVKLVRTDKRGIFREASVNLEYVFDGAFYLREAFYSAGVNAELSFRIERKNTETLQTEVIFNGFFDFETFQDGIKKVTCNAIDGSIEAKIREQENQEFAIEVSNFHTLDFACITYTYNSILSKVQTNTVNNEIMTFGLTFQQSKEKAPYDRYIDTFSVNQQSSYHPFLRCTDANGKVRLRVQIDGILQVILNAPVDPMVDNSFQVFIVFLNESGGEGYIIAQKSGTWHTQGVAENIDFSLANIIDTTFTRNLSNNTNYCLTVTVTSANSGYDTFTSIKGNDLNVAVEVQGNGVLQKEINCLPEKELFQALLTQIDSSLILDSDYLNTICDTDSNMIPLFTSGNIIRGIDNKIKISFKQLFEAMQRVQFIGAGVVGNNYRIEPVSYWYNSDDSYSLGSVSKFKLQPMEHFGGISAGFPDKEINIQGSLFDVHSEQEWKLPIKSKQKADFQSKNVIFSMYETMRIILDSVPTETKYYADDKIITEVQTNTDKESDNETLIFDCEAFSVQPLSIGYNLSRDKFTTVTGFEFNDEAYNLLWTPKRNLLRCGGDIRSLLYENNDNTVLTSAAKNTNVTTQIGTEQLIDEGGDIAPSRFGTALFLPFYATISIAQPVNFTDIINNLKERQMFSFDYEGTTFYGYLEEAGVRAGKRSEIEVKLILANVPENDLTKLIK